MTDPMDSLRLLQQAIDEQVVGFQHCEIFPDIAVHFDKPNDVPRFTYVRMENGIAQSIALFVMGEPVEGIHCFQMGWATVETMRRNGLATDVASKAVEELKNGMNRNGINRFYIEAIIAETNTESQRLASRMFPDPPEPCTDSLSGETALQYLRLVE
jgi:RimJ/RimL family protein N-acetyltransferase